MMRALLTVTVVSAFGFAACPCIAQTSPEDIARKAEKAVQGGSERDYQRELTRSVWEGMRAAATDGSKAVTELRVMSVSFKNQLKELLESANGRKLATSAEAVTAFIDLYSRPLPRETELQGWSTRLNEIATVAAARVSDGGLVQPTKEQFAEAARLSGPIEKWTVQLRSNARMLEDLLKLVKDAPSDGPTLQDVVRQRSIERLKRELAAWNLGTAAGDAEAERLKREGAESVRVEEAKRQVEEAVATGIAEANFRLWQAQAKLVEQQAAEQVALAMAQEDAKEKIAQLQRDLKLAEANRTKADAVAEGKVKETLADAEHTRRLNELNTKPEILGALAPFTTTGDMTLRGKPMFTPGPISRTELQDIGALNPTIEGLSAMSWHVFNSKDKRRPKFGYSDLSNGRAKSLKNVSEATLAGLRQAQAYLIEYGDVLVETGKLSP